MREPRICWFYRRGRRSVPPCPERTVIHRPFRGFWLPSTSEVHPTGLPFGTPFGSCSPSCASGLRVARSRCGSHLMARCSAFRVHATPVVPRQMWWKWTRSPGCCWPLSGWPGRMRSRRVASGPAVPERIFHTFSLHKVFTVDRSAHAEAAEVALRWS